MRRWAATGRRPADAARLVPGRALAAAFLLCLLGAGYLAWQPQGATAADWVDDLAELVAAAGAAVLAGLAWRRLRGTSQSLPWLLLAVGLAAWTAGQAITCWYELLHDADTPFPGIADVGFLAFPPLAVVALQRLATASDGRRWYRNLLDGMILVSSLLVVTWDTSLGQLWAGRSGGAWPTGVALAYPASDIVLAAAAFLSIGRAPRSRRQVLRVLALGMVAMSVADSAYTYLWTLPEYGSWQALDAGWPFAFALMGLAAWRAGAGNEAEERTDLAEQGWFEIALPYVPLAAALCLMFGRSIVTGRLDKVTDISGAVTVTLVFVRQLLVLADNKALVRVVQHQALHDPLTGLANRVLFNDRLERATQRLRMRRLAFAVLFLDLDDFKGVNDSLGHPVGDQLLALLAARLRECLGPDSTIARFGGDEFAVLLEGPDPIAVSRRFLAAMDDDLVPYGHSVSARMSIGVALSDEREREPFEYLRRADVALYAAKAAGKNTYHVYSSTLDVPPQAPRSPQGDRRAVR